MCKRVLCLVAFTAILYAPSTGLAGPSQLGSAQDFAVLGAQGVTNTNSTRVYGSLGIHPNNSITGFFGTVANDGPGVVTGGTIHEGDAVAQQAQADSLTAYNTLKALPFTSNLTGQDLGTVGTLSPGVYYFSSTAALTGTLTLDFASNPGGDFVFQVGTALTTASSSTVNVINGSATSGVYWLMGVTGGSGTGSATLGSSSTFAGNIIALDSISFGSTADILCGRAIALNAAVTMIGNDVSNNNTAEDFGSLRSDFGSYGFSGGSAPVVPVPGAFLLVCSGIGSVLAFRRRLSSIS